MMKERLAVLLNRYCIIILSFLPAILMVRFAEFLSLQYLHTVPANTWLMELPGYLLDNLVFFSFAIVMLVPFILFSLFSRRVATIFIFTVLLVFILISLVLVKYFTMALVPLDQVLFYYTPNEVVRIALSSTPFDISGVITFIIVFISPVVIYFFIRKIRLNRILLIIFPAILLASPLLMIYLSPSRTEYTNDFEYFARSSKTEYLVRKLVEHHLEMAPMVRNDRSFAAAVKRFRYENREFSYTDPQYPFLRVDATPDVLGGYFNFNKDKPNLVFIIVESLSSSFCGDHPYYGSYTPFLDSLIGHSLYWKNFLSTSERTFNVLPAIFGSLPYSDEIFRKSNCPLHFSMIRYLRTNGYYVDFFYGGDPAMGEYNRFLENEGTDYILSYFGKGYPDLKTQKKINKWGYFDSDLFKRSTEVIDSINRSPRLDIYLTLSTHSPFVTPDRDHYGQLLDETLKKSNQDANIKRMVSLDRNIFTTVLYTDDALRSFFNTYRKRKDFNNTLFFITGDHAMPEIHYTYLNLLEKFHVPFIIYSPMLKKPVMFQSVSSHLDITPSVLAMLKNQGFITTMPVCHWLGKGIDVSEEFENNHAVSFIYNNRAQTEYLDKDYFISSGRLFRLLPDLKLYPLENKALKEKMLTEFEDYLYLTREVAARHSLIPDAIYVAANYREVPYQFPAPEQLNKVLTTEEYIQVVKVHLINNDLQYMKINLSVTLRNESGDTLNDPKLVFSIQDDKLKDYTWVQFRLKTIARTGGERRMSLTEYIDVSDVPDITTKNLKIYLLNLNREKLYLDDLKIELKGYKIIK